MIKRTLSKNGSKFISDFEGLYLRAYDDLQPSVKLTASTKIKGTLTIGIGHIGNVDGEPIKWNTTITTEKAYELLKQDCSERVNILNSKLKVTITQNMFDALLSYCYNCGFGNAHAVKCIDYINKGQFEKASLEIKNGTNTSKGIVLAGLTRRRKSEYELFIKNMYMRVKTTTEGVSVREQPKAEKKTTIIERLPKGKIVHIVALKTTTLGTKYGQRKSDKKWIRLKNTITI